MHHEEILLYQPLLLQSQVDWPCDDIVSFYRHKFYHCSPDILKLILVCKIWNVLKYHNQLLEQLIRLLQGSSGVSLLGQQTLEERLLQYVGETLCLVNAFRTKGHCLICVHVPWFELVVHGSPVEIFLVIEMFGNVWII